MTLTDDAADCSIIVKRPKNPRKSVKNAGWGLGCFGVRSQSAAHGAAGPPRTAPAMKGDVPAFAAQKDKVLLNDQDDPSRIMPRAIEPSGWVLVARTLLP